MTPNEQKDFAFAAQLLGGEIPTIFQLNEIARKRKKDESDRRFQSPNEYNINLPGMLLLESLLISLFLDITIYIKDCINVTIKVLNCIYIKCIYFKNTQDL